jgi:hypothetical protein
MGWDRARTEQVNATMLKAYRRQYIVSGTLEPRFQKVLAKLVSAQQWAAFKRRWVHCATRCWHARWRTDAGWMRTARCRSLGGGLIFPSLARDRSGLCGKQLPANTIDSPTAEVLRLAPT